MPVAEAVLATKVILTRVTANKTVKIGDDVKLTYKYDHVNSETENQREIRLRR